MENIWDLNNTKAGENRGVSPVIATVLVVAIVVIISASIAAVTLGFTDQLGDPAPTAAFEFDHGDGWEITHTQGDSIDADALQIRIDDPDGVADNVTDWPGEGSVSAGSAVKVGGSDTTGNEDVSIIWEDGSDSYSIGSTGSSSGSASGGGGGGGSPTLIASFENDELEAGPYNQITATLKDENGNPIVGETVSVTVSGDATVLGSSTSLIVEGTNRDKSEDITTNTTGGLGSVNIGSAPDLDPGDVIEVEIEATETGISKTIDYEIIA